jgi:hypothetical protein
MFFNKNVLLLVLGCLVLTPMLSGAEDQFLFREEFKDLAQWDPLVFPKVQEHTRYSAESLNGETFLKAESHASASGLIRKGVYSVAQYPKVRFRWKIDRVYRNGDEHKKRGDDYPIRVYVVFAYDPEKAGTWEKLSYESYRMLYGEYPPHSSLNYIWANRAPVGALLPSPYTARSMMKVLQSGNARAGEWVTQEVNVLDDYQKAFGELPPDQASIAIMNDSDNTGEASVSYVGTLEVFR